MKYLAVSKNVTTFALALGKWRFPTIKRFKSLMTKAKKCKNVDKNLVVTKNQLTFAKFSAVRKDGMTNENIERFTIDNSKYKSYFDLSLI